ncbi:MAG TPA: hypothetical protein VGN88_08115 [Phycisphaerae bacterium]|jgi:hypothetical protein
MLTLTRGLAVALMVAAVTISFAQSLPSSAPATNIAPATTRSSTSAPAAILQTPSTASYAADPPIGTAKLLLSEDFESIAAGEIPKGFTKTGAVGVVTDVAHSGKNSLRMEAAPKGPRRITLKGEIVTSLGGTHWGRLYYKVQTPTPAPAGNGVIHSTLVSGTAQSPLAQDPIEVRMLDTVLGNKGTHQYIYNVQPTKRNEFGKGGAYDYKYKDEWQLAEWYIDYPTQSYRLFINGKEIKDVARNNGAGNFKNTEIPEVFESLSFGWYNYQVADTGFVAWIDDIALSKERIGTRGLPEESAKP